MADHLTSAGMAIDARATVEADFSPVVDKAVEKFLREVRDMATGGDTLVASGLFLSSPVSASAGAAFAAAGMAQHVAMMKGHVDSDEYALFGGRLTLGAVAKAWADIMGGIVPTLASTLPVGAQTVYATKLAARLVGDTFAESAFEAVQAVLSAGLDQGWSQRKVLREMGKALTFDAKVDPRWANRARAIARTEATSVSATKRLYEMADEGIEKKRWVARHDDITRPSHAAADGQVQTLGQPFKVGGYALLHPGDPDAPAEERMNCRCVLVGVR